MRLSSLFYLTKQGWKNMVNNRMMAVASIGILTACLFITGAAVLLGLNVNGFADYLAGQNEVVLYLLDGIERPVQTLPAEGEIIDGPQDGTPAEDGQDDAQPEDAGDAADGEDAAAVEGDDVGDIVSAEPPQPQTELVPVDIDAIVSTLESIDNIDSYTYVSKDEALTEAIGWMGGYANLLEGYREDNPMPASFRITVKDLSLLDETVSTLQTMEGVEYINAPNEMAGILLTLKNTITWVAVGLVAVLGLVCVVVIGNTIRLTVFARRREINIMKYVGATNGFIRWPFFVEGMTCGLLAGLLAFGLLSLGYTQLVDYLTADGIGFAWLNNLFYSVLSYESLRQPMLLAFVVAGVVLGGIGTAGSVRKYLKV